MFEELFGRYLEEMDEKAEEYNDLSTECAKVQSELSNAAQLINGLLEKYAHKYGTPISSEGQMYSREEIELIRLELQDTSLLTLLKRFFGIGKKTSVIYTELVQKLSGLIVYLRGERERLTEEMSDIEQEIRECAGQIRENVVTVRDEINRTDGKYIKLGDITDRIDAEGEPYRFIAESLPELVKDKYIILPYVRDINIPANFAIQYSGEPCRKQSNQLVRSLLYQMIRKGSDYERVFHFFDGSNTGQDFGELIELQKIREGHVWELNSAVTGSQYQFAKVYFSNNDIREGLQALDETMSRIANEAGAYSSINEYNASEEAKKRGKIPQQVVVIQNFPAGFGDTEIRSVAKLVNNGGRRGISVYIQYDFSNLKTVEQKFRPLINSAYKASEELLESMYFDKEVVRLGANDYSAPIVPVSTEGDRGTIQRFVAEKTRVKEVDNTFENLLIGNYEPGSRKAVEGLYIPFAVDRRGRVKELELGTAEKAHALISGGTGSGKSSLMHTLICSASYLYGPDELEIWLADYKRAEFNPYKLNAPPQVTFIGLSTSSDFTYAFLDKIEQEYVRRLQIFKEATDALHAEGKDVAVTNYATYRQVTGRKDLRRLIVIVDEFHVLAQQVAENDYKTKLENLLAEVRATGITLIFSDQSVTQGLRGLTEKGKNQMHCRIALRNNTDELKEMLQTDSKESVRPFLNMATGDLVLVTKEKTRSASGDLVAEVVREQCRGIFLAETRRPEICRIIRENYHMAAVSPEYMDEEEDIAFDSSLIDRQEQLAPVEDFLPVYFGRALNLTGFFRVELERRRTENMMCVGGNDDERFNMICAAILSFARIEGHKIYIFSDPYSRFMRKYKMSLDALCRESKDADMFSEPEDICERINEIQVDMMNRRKEWNTLIIWLGLDELYSEFQNYPEEKPEKYKAALSRRNSRSAQKQSGTDLEALLSASEAKWDALFGGELDVLNSQEQNESAYDKEDYLEEDDDYEEDVYNAVPDIVSILREGSKRGIFSFVIYDTAYPVKSNREFKLDFFSHKISFSISKDDTYDYLGRSNLLDDLKPDTGLAAYYDGRTIFKFKVFSEEKKNG